MSLELVAPEFSNLNGTTPFKIKQWATTRRKYMQQPPLETLTEYCTVQSTTDSALPADPGMRAHELGTLLLLLVVLLLLYSRTKLAS